MLSMVEVPNSGSAWVPPSSLLEGGFSVPVSPRFRPAQGLSDPGQDRGLASFCVDSLTAVAALGCVHALPTRQP